jgi:hypothetical protein
MLRLNGGCDICRLSAALEIFPALATSRKYERVRMSKITPPLLYFISMVQYLLYVFYFIPAICYCKYNKRNESPAAGQIEKRGTNI